MSSVTHLRDVWKQVLLLQRGEVLLQKRMDLHTAGELERIVISQARGEHDLKSGGKWQSAKQFRLTGYPISSAYLVPGGRFFLNLTETAAVVYVDLDGPEFTWREVIPSSPAGIQHLTVSFEHVVDAPMLTLHVAIAIERHLPPFSSARSEELTWEDTPHPVQEISIWRVRPQFDSRGVVCGKLQATRLSQFRHSPKGIKAPQVDSIKLQGDHLVVTQNDSPSICSVIQWAAANGLSANVPRKVVSHESCHVRSP